VEVLVHLLPPLLSLVPFVLEILLLPPLPFALLALSVLSLSLSPLLPPLLPPLLLPPLLPPLPFSLCS
jgi:hypothetical protein